jgi:hypothetical protein
VPTNVRLTSRDAITAQPREIAGNAASLGNIARRFAFNVSGVSVPKVSQPSFIRITPDQLATLSLCRAANALEQAAADPATWLFIILDLNRAVTAALVAALSAYDFAEAYDPEFRARLTAFFEDDAQEPGPFRVPSLEGLLTLAAAGTTSMQALQLTPEQRADILTLNEFRHRLEHVRPETLLLNSTHLPRIAKNAAGVFEIMLQAFKHHLEPDEIERTNCALGKLGWRRTP